MWRPDKPTRFTEEPPPPQPNAVVQNEIVAQPSQSAPAPPEPSIGEKLALELDTVSRRERQIRELQDLTLRRVAELKTEQLRQILEFLE